MSAASFDTLTPVDGTPIGGPIWWVRILDFSIGATWKLDDGKANIIKGLHSVVVAAHAEPFRTLTLTAGSNGTYPTVQVGRSSHNYPGPEGARCGALDSQAAAIVAGQAPDSIGRTAYPGVLVVGGFDSSGNIDALAVDSVTASLNVCGYDAIGAAAVAPPVLVGARDAGGFARGERLDSQGRPSSASMPIRPCGSSVIKLTPPAAAANLLSIYIAGGGGGWITRLALLNPGAQTAASIRELWVQRFTVGDFGAGAVSTPLQRGGNAGGVFSLAAVVRNSPSLGAAVLAGSADAWPVMVPGAVADYAPRYFIGGPGADPTLSGALFVPAGTGFAVVDKTGGAGGVANSQYWYVEWVENSDTSNLSQ